MKIYLAARYSRCEELCGYRDQLRAMGHDIQARWLDGEHQLANDGTPIGENGEALVEGTLRSGEQISEHEQTQRATELRTRFALDDWEDVNAAQLVINFTEPPRSKANRGGRHVEYGIALAKRTRVIVVGHRENIFHWLPQVQFFHTWDEARDAVGLPKEPKELAPPPPSQMPVLLVTGPITIDPNDPEWGEILSHTVLFCGPIANILQRCGYDIPRKAEHEQSAVLLWMLSLYRDHGKAWREKGQDILNELRKKHGL